MKTQTCQNFKMFIHLTETVIFTSKTSLRELVKNRHHPLHYQVTLETDLTVNLAFLYTDACEQDDTCYTPKKGFIITLIKCIYNNFSNFFLFCSMHIKTSVYIYVTLLLWPGFFLPAQTQTCNMKHCNATSLQCSESIF